MKSLIFLLLFSSIGGAAQIAIPTTCYVRRQFSFAATTTSVPVASSGSDINCWIVQNKDGTNSVFGTINASMPISTSGFEVGANTIYQIFTGPYNTLYIRSSTGSINTDILSGKTTPQ